MSILKGGNLSKSTIEPKLEELLITISPDPLIIDFAIEIFKEE